MKKKFTLPCLLLLIASGLSAQPFLEWNDSIPVKIGGVTIDKAWAGGLNFIQMSSIDLNQDGIKDLFLFDRTGNKIRTFINKGTAGASDYRYDPQYETKFPKLSEWAILADYNCDGKADIFTYSRLGGGIDIWKNISTVATGLQFQLVKSQVRSRYNPPSTSTTNLYVSSVDVPAISDIDNDGDLDVVTFAITGTYMEYHKNMSKELYGSCDSLEFQMANRCWGYAAENSLSNSYTLHDTCFGNISSPELPPLLTDTRSAERHSGSCQLCIDLDGDNDKEFIVGDVSFNNLTMLTNGGTLTNSNFIAKDTLFPKNNSSTIPIDLTIFPCAYYEDVNNDNVKDLIVSPNATNACENFNSVVYYKNTGTNNFPIFNYQQGNLLQDNMIEVGEGAYPTFFDYDNDGLKDMFIGNYGYYGSSGFQHEIAQFHNTGTASAPKFDLVTRDYNGGGAGPGFSTLGIINMVPTFGDLDGDGDADLIIGAYDGKLHYFQNVASAGAPAQFVLAEANFKNANNRVIDVGDFASPQIVDVDGDGKNDIIVGGKNGKISYFHHIGTGSTALLSLDSVTNYFGSVKVNQAGYFTGYSYPFMFKQSGVTRMLVGAESGYLGYYDHIDGNLTGVFSTLDSTYLDINQGTRTAPFGADINNDGYMDLIVGNYEGGVSFYKGVSNLTTASMINNLIPFNFDAFPNPADDNFTVQIINDRQMVYSIELFDVLGRLVSSAIASTDRVNLETKNIPQGMYICRVSEMSPGGARISGVLTRKIIVRHGS